MSELELHFTRMRAHMQRRGVIFRFRPTCASTRSDATKPAVHVRPFVRPSVHLCLELCIDLPLSVCLFACLCVYVPV